MRRHWMLAVVVLLVMSVTFGLGVTEARAAQSDAVGATVNWAIYSDGTLVINGPNTENYDGHGEIQKSGTNFSTSKQYSPSGIRGAYVFPPWCTSRSMPSIIKGQNLYYRVTPYFKKVEFASLTKPRNMYLWFEGSSLESIDFNNLVGDNITNLLGTFQDCKSFSKLLNASDFNASSVWKFSSTFNGCSKLSDISSLSFWDVSSVTDMSGLFEGCSNLSDISPLSSWDVSRVTDMSSMFQSCSKLSDISVLSSWVTSSVTDMNRMFFSSNIMDVSALTNWNTQKVNDMSYLFYCCNLTGVLDLSSWDVSRVTDMQSMFKSCTQIEEIHIENWKPSTSSYFTDMFSGCSALKTIYCNNKWSGYSYGEVFEYCHKLSSMTSGMSYNYNADGVAMCNPDTGYFTDDATMLPASFVKEVVDSEGNHVDWNFLQYPIKFSIEPKDHVSATTKTEAMTDQTGKVDFGRIKIKEGETLSYVITEENPDIPGYVWDSTPHTLTVSLPESEPDIVTTGIYGVTYDPDQNGGAGGTKWERTDDAAGFADPNPYVADGKHDNGESSSPFDDIAPWKDIKRVAVKPTGEVHDLGLDEHCKSGSGENEMVAIPKFWYSLKEYGNGGLALQISPEDKSGQDGWYVSPAHMDRGDGKGERDWVYLARYHTHLLLDSATREYQSVTNEKPVAGIKGSDGRKDSAAVGAGWCQSDYLTRFTVELLYLVKYADFDSQNAIGYGCGNSYSAVNTGYTDSMPYHTGTTEVSRTTYGYCQYRYVEGLWDNMCEFMDGVRYADDGIYIEKNPVDFSELSGGILVGKLFISSSGNHVPLKFTVSINAGCPVFLSADDRGMSNSKGLSDTWRLGSSSYPYLLVGGADKHNDVGLFGVSIGSVYQTYARVGSRLLYLPSR